jgi:hypothetical protein
MTCDWYEQQLATDTVDLWPAGHPSSALLDHARTCSSCDRLVQRELVLKRQLVNLAQKNQALQPSPSVKRSLLAELDSLHPSPTPRRMRIIYYAIAGAAIICLVVALLSARRPHPTAPSLANTPAVKPAPIVPETTPTTAPSTPTVVARHEAPARRRSPATLTASNTDFYPVVMCDSVTCAGPALTVRVQLPRSPLATRGSNTPVMADLLVGEDGLVRGVRLLQ